MCHSTTRTIVLRVALYLMMTGNCLAYNYPSDANTIKPCARRKNTILTKGPLCVWDDNAKKYTTNSLEFCNRTSFTFTLKKECPEFNQATCALYKDIHCCKLRYKAKGTTWMEVYYANQYKPGDYDKPEDQVYDIIEINRMVDPNYEKDFGNVSQFDFPNNVIDPKGGRGLKWIDVQNPKKNNFINPISLCNNSFKDYRCSEEYFAGSSYQYLKDNYPDGFDPAVKIPRTPYEDEVKATIKITYSSWCRDALINRRKVPTCTTYHRRYGIPADGKSAVTQFIFLESQIICDDQGNFKLRYAYWNIEDVQTRDLIFKDGSIKYD